MFVYLDGDFLLRDFFFLSVVVALQISTIIIPLLMFSAYCSSNRTVDNLEFITCALAFWMSSAGCSSIEHFIFE